MTKQVKKSVLKAVSANQVLVSLDAIALTQEKWNKQYEKVNHSLYTILSASLEEVIVLRSAPRAVAIEFNALLKERGYKRLDATSLETKVLRVVFGEIDKDRASSYSKVLREAKKNEIEPCDLSAWIQQEGGIEAIRRGKHAKINLEEKREVAVTNCIKALDVAPVFDLNSLTKLEGLEYSVVVMRKSNDGVAEPVAEVTSLSTVKNVLASLKDIAESAQQSSSVEHDENNLLDQAEIIRTLLASVEAAGITIPALMKQAA